MNVNQTNFACRITHALDQRVDQLPAATVQRLADARALALARKKPDSRTQSVNIDSTDAKDTGRWLERPTWRIRLAAALPMVAVAAGIFIIYQSAYQERISDVAEIDAMVLADELPLRAYTDTGFNAFLATRAEQLR